MILCYAKAFRSDYKLICKRKWDFKKVVEQVGKITRAERDHNLKGKLTGKRECHIGFDWVLVYEVVGDAIKLLRTGTHEDVLGV